MSLSGEDKDKFLLELIAIKGIDLYIIKDKLRV
jgi:hypothetical protein